MDIIAPALSTAPLRYRIDWSTWHVFWADERWVPRFSPDSNYGVAEKLLLNHVPIPDGQIYAMDQSDSPHSTARSYEVALKKAFQTDPGQIPRFDLILLGVGEDGHTASLFPGHPVLKETVRWMAPVLNAPKPPPMRITMTLALINNADHIVFVVAGANKANIISDVFHPPDGHKKIPVLQVNPVNGNLRWFVDQQAYPSALTRNSEASEDER